MKPVVACSLKHACAARGRLYESSKHRSTLLIRVRATSDHTHPVSAVTGHTTLPPLVAQPAPKRRFGG